VKRSEQQSRSPSINPPFRAKGMSGDVADTHHTRVTMDRRIPAAKRAIAFRVSSITLVV
jgi:hypothetical protein